jgi:hypothetical protein
MHRIGQVLEDMPKNDHIVKLTARIVVVEKVRNRDVDALVFTDIVGAVLQQLHTTHLPTRFARKVQQTTVATTDVHERAGLRGVLTQEVPALPDVYVSFVMLNKRANIVFGVLCLIKAALQIVVPEGTALAFVVNKILMAPFGHPGNDISGATQATGFKHGRGPQRRIEL